MHFFSGDRVAIKVPMAKGKNITGKYYKDIVLEKPKKYYQKRCPVTVLKHIRLLHGNVTAHASEIVTSFLKKEKVTVLPHLPYSIDLVQCDFFMFSEIEIIPCWSEIPVLTGTWICFSSVPFYCAQISVS